MSYDVVIAAPPLPERDSHAWKMLDTVAEAESAGEARAIYEQFRDRIAGRYPCLSTLSEDELDRSVWSADMRTMFSGPQPVLNLRFSSEREVLPYIIESARSLGLSVLDWQAGLVHRADGIPGLVLTVENRNILRAPTVPQLEDAVDALTPRGGPGFLILESPGEDYAQAAGGDGEFTVEWREYAGGTFQHWVAGLPFEGTPATIAIQTNGAEVTVQENESLVAEEVNAILAAFARQEGRPAQFLWREITGQFT